MRLLAARLDAIAYPALHALAAGGRPLVDDVEEALASTGTSPEWSWYRLLGLGRQVGAAELAGVGFETAVALVEAGLLVETDGLLSTTGWIVVPALGGRLVTGLPPTHGGAAGASAYLGPDSLRLAASLPPAEGRRVLDLGAGCGVQGLLACRGASEAVLTDVDPTSLHISALNAVLNRCEHPFRLLEGSLYEPVSNERFDLVVSLPPYVPVVEGCGVTVVAAGGADGLGFLVPLLDGAASVLEDGGELWCLAQLLCDDEGPLLRERLDRAAESLTVELYCTDRHPLRPWIADVAGRLARHGAGLSAADLAAAYSASLRPLGATGVCAALVRARAGGAPGVRITGAKSGLVAGSRLRHAGPLVTGPAALEAVTLEGAGPVHLDKLGLTLLDAFDGSSDISQATLASWGSPPDADWRDIEEMAVLRATELLRSGLLERVPVADDVAIAPFDDDELDALDRHQHCGEESYRCPEGDGCELIPEADGWRCPRCGARQTWAFLRHLDDNDS